MDADRFSKLLKNPARTQQDLETMRRNAIDKGNIDLAAIATDVLKIVPRLGPTAYEAWWRNPDACGLSQRFTRLPK